MQPRPDRVISSILRHDRKQNSYKIALLRALNDAVLSFPAGGTSETAIMVDTEYRAALLAKLVEEAQEAANAEPCELVTELADLLEVVEATMTAYGLSRSAVEEEQLGC